MKSVKFQQMLGFWKWMIPPHYFLCICSIFILVSAHVSMAHEVTALESGEEESRERHGIYKDIQGSNGEFLWHRNSYWNPYSFPRDDQRLRHCNGPEWQDNKMKHWIPANVFSPRPPTCRYSTEQAPCRGRSEVLNHCVPCCLSL